MSQRFASAPRRSGDPHSVDEEEAPSLVESAVEKELAAIREGLAALRQLMEKKALR